MGSVQEERPNRLHLDNVLSTQPELGPNIPDGGYGWVVVIASIFFHVLIPSISVGFGVFILFHRLENGASQEPQLWDNQLVYVALFFIVTSTLTAPINRLLCRNSTWPRLVSTAGTCLTCAGLLIMWTTINTKRTVVYALAGIFSGAGASIILTQTDVILSQYFKLKIELIRTIMHLSEAIGFVITPIALGCWIVKHGMLHIITWYQAVILQGIIFSIAFRKPKYLKLSKQKYRLIRGLSDEEEDVFAKNVTELQEPRALEIPTDSIRDQENTLKDLDISSRSSKNWETFEDQSSSKNTKPTKTHTELHKSFAEEFSKDFDKTAIFEDNYVEVPKPLFFEPQINNNTSYSYESPIEVSTEPVVFMPVDKPEQDGNFKKALYVLKQPTFYKSLLFFVTTKYSIFIFWTLFPTYLYEKINNLNVHNIPIIVGSVSVGSLIFAPLLNWIKSNRKTRPIFFWIFCWMGAIGYIILDTSNKTLLIFGAFVIILSINALHILGYPLMMFNSYGEQSSYFFLLNIITGLLLTIFLTIDLSYRTCFQVMSILNFLTGSLWLVNFLYKQIKKIH